LKKRFFKKTRLNRIKDCLFCLYFGTKKMSFFCLYYGTEGVLVNSIDVQFWLNLLWWCLKY